MTVGVRLIPDDYSLGVHFITYDQLNLAEVATENMYRESLFSLLAHEIADFPYKQRRALLIDLANRMRFETQPTALQEAFLEVGIQLQDYQQPLPTNPVERRQHASLLNHAYKRIAALTCMQEYVSAA